MSNTKTVSFPILGILGLILGLIFVTLKLAEIGVVATWSWCPVLSPFWIQLAVVLGIFAVAGIAVLASKVFM